jgi:rod shape-determining protein MreB and related proteins
LVRAVKGRDLVTGTPKTIEVNSTEIREALKEQINAIVDTVLICLEKTPPELAADIFDNGIFLSGGGSLLRNLDILLCEKTMVPVMIAENPLDCVALGSGKVLDELDLLRRVSITS